MEPDLIFSLNRKKEVCCWSRAIGFLYGISASSQDQQYGCGSCKIDFIDIDFKSPDQGLQDELAMKYKPKYACVLDITHESMIDSAICQALWFQGHGIEPIVIPKIDCSGDIPKCFILGYSIKTKYGGTDVAIETFKDRKIHILGGSPQRQLKYYIRFLELGCKVISIDGNAANRAATFGQIFRDGKWENSYLQGNFWGECLRTSLVNIWQFWQEAFCCSSFSQLVFWK